MLPARFASSHIVSVALILGMLTTLMACNSGDERNVIDTGTSFTKEGSLSFIAPGDSVLHTINIEIAETDQERSRGLMFRRSMSYGQGMLFLFDEADTEGFWMKNTPMSLDIIFVGPDSQVVSIAERTQPFSEELIRPEAPKQFVVEVRAGFADRFGITPGTRIRWERDA